MVILPYQVDVPMERWPIANWVLLAVIAAVIALQVHGSGDGFEPYVLDGWSVRGLFGHMWLHVGIVHAVGNMLFLWTFGNAVCAKVGNGLFLLVYLLLGLVAGASHLLFADGSAVGASGAINGVIGMYLIFYPLNTVTCFYWIWVRVGRLSVSGFWLILLWLAFDILGVVTRAAGVAYWAHIGGFVTGLALAIGLLVTGLVRMKRSERSLLDVFRPERQDGGRGLYKPARQSASTDGDALPGSAGSAAGAGGDSAPIRVECSCGQVLKIPGRFAGRMVKCPVCGQAIRAREA